MAVAIDTRWLNIPAGVAGQIRGLLQGLAASDKTQDYLSFGAWPGINQPNFHHCDLTGWRRRGYQGLWKTLQWPPLEWLLGEQPLVHFTNGTLAPLYSPKTKIVLTIHDLTFLHYPETLERHNLRFVRRFCPEAIRKADRVIAVSQYTKSDILNNFAVQEGQIVVIPNAADPIFSQPIPPDARQAVLARYQISKPYILFVGTLEPRKNVQLLLNACRRLPATLRQQYALILAGLKGWQQSPLNQLNQRLDSLGQQMTVHRLDYVPQNDLASLYQSATVFVLPSLFEGFGIPVLEAMASGVPVLAANNSSLPEVVGEAGWLFADNDEEDLTAKLGHLLVDSEQRAQLRQRGLERAKQFSWTQSGQRLKTLYQELLA